MADEIIIRYALADAYTHCSLCDAIENAALRERALRYRNEEARLESLLGAYCVEECAKTLGVMPGKTEYNFSGKPQASDFEFNVSHSHGLALCAASKKYGVGIDVEPVLLETEKTLFRDGVARRRFSQRESNGLFQIDDPLLRSVEFIRLWTAHEALGKYLGVGVFRGDVLEYTRSNKLCIRHFVLRRTDGHVSVVSDGVLLNDTDSIYYIICICSPDAASSVILDKVRTI